MTYPSYPSGGSQSGQQLPYYPQRQESLGAYPGPYFGGPAGMGAAPLSCADLGSRLGARLLDLVFWGAGYAVLGVPLAMWIDRTESEVPHTLILLWLATSFTLYFPLCTARFGATLGKRICGVRVVRANSGQKIGFGRALGREFFWLLAFPVPVLSLLNPLWCCWDKPLRQCLHDKVADTMTLDA